MERIIFITFLLTAVFSFSACFANQYHFMNINLTWTEAQRYCRVNYTDLVTINSKTDINEMMKTVKDESVQHVWIGLHKTQNKTWKWSLGNPAFYTGSDSHYQNWESNNIHVVGDCVCMDGQNGKWDNKKCAEYKNFICYNDKFVLIQQNLTWNEALKYCRDNHVDLVSVESQQIQNSVMNVVKNALTAVVWLGLRQACALGIWFWVNGEIVCYQDWAAGNGTGVEDCSDTAGAVLSGDNQTWISLPQTLKLNFICTNYEEHESNAVATTQDSEATASQNIFYNRPVMSKLQLPTTVVSI
ncbi:C-type mannose receptor 2-like [Xyrauchen texanus]|uniref:C-type mannose receptor 2-like n=1 Tax=Xyrauchen texanus TaxID=154827 RepID=UPI002242AF28|nr:C-type mannose receptor 2-like [Xyrauchen texanus]